jgi:DNA repair exonuclease SbcCD ATPase subunit
MQKLVKSKRTKTNRPLTLKERLKLATGRLQAATKDLESKESKISVLGDRIDILERNNASLRKMADYQPANRGISPKADAPPPAIDLLRKQVNKIEDRIAKIEATFTRLTEAICDEH